MDELISVVIPIYNVEQYLSKCIESVQKQTYRNIEIILVDDESPDKCGQICDAYAESDNRIRVIHKKNGGLSDARNVGIEKAKGEYIVFIDSDDYVSEKYIDILYKLCKKYSYGIAQCGYLPFDKENFKPTNDEILEKSIDKIEALSMEGENNVETNIAWNKMYKRDLFDNIKYPVGKIHEDEATTYKLIYKAENIAVTNQKLYYYRQRSESIMQEKYNLKRLDYIEALEGRLEYYKYNKEKYLYYHTLILYCFALKDAYILAEKYIENSNEICKKLKIKLKQNYKKIIFCKQTGINKIIKITLFLVSPKIYKKLFWLKRGEEKNI